jgi:rhomboid family GlyGly-CTERM serine protease
MQSVPNPAFAPCTALLVLCSVVLAAWGDSAVIDRLTLDRHALMQGEVWRLWTGHFVHFSAQHAWVNILVLASTGNIVERYIGRFKFAFFVPSSVVFISAGLLLWQPTLLEYRGLSAIATMLTVAALFVVAKQHRAATIYLVLLGILLSAKLIGEAFGITSVAADLPAGVAVEWRSHVLGAAAGLMLIGWLVIAEMLGCRVPKYGRLQPI